MWKQIRPALVVLSIALNVAFAGVWFTYAAASRIETRATRCEPGDGATVWCPLHQQLNVGAEQWKEIEPRLRTFRVSADEISREIGRLRREIIDELAVPSPDLEKVTAKQAKILEGQRSMQRLVIEQLMSEKRILTAGQQELLFDLLRGATAQDRGGPLLVPGRGHETGIGQMLRTGGQD